MQTQTGEGVPTQPAACYQYYAAAVAEITRTKNKKIINRKTGLCFHRPQTESHSNVRVTTAASETEGVAAVSWIESLMIRRPFGSIDPNSIRETELHKQSRRRHTRGERESLHSPQLDRERDAARQRAAATRREQWTVLSGTSTIGHGLHAVSYTHLTLPTTPYV